MHEEIEMFELLDLNFWLFLVGFLIPICLGVVLLLTAKEMGVGDTTRFRIMGIAIVVSMFWNLLSIGLVMGQVREAEARLLKVIKVTGGVDK